MTLELPPPLKIETALGAIDAEARRTSNRARTQTVAVVKRLLPARSGRAQSATRGSVRRAPDGYTITVAPSPRVRYPGGLTAREVTRFVEGGTGTGGPRGQAIPPKRRGRLPSGAVPSGRGQRAQHPYARAESVSEAAVTRTLEQGADVAAAAAERVLGNR